MWEQISLFQLYPGQDPTHRYGGKPDYKGSLDEITRYTIETDFELSISLDDCCCGGIPEKRFKSCHDYAIVCPKCDKRTKYYRHQYESMQAWNRGEYV